MMIFRSRQVVLFRDPSKAGTAINLKRVFFYRSCFRFHGSSIDKFKFKTIPKVGTWSVTDRSIVIAWSSSTGMEFHEFIVDHSRFPRKLRGPWLWGWMKKLYRLKTRVKTDKDSVIKRCVAMLMKVIVVCLNWVWEDRWDDQHSTDWLYYFVCIKS